MRTVANLLAASEKINISLQVELSLIEASEDYVRIQQEQLSRGERADGHPIFNIKTFSDEYSLRYAKYKGKNKPIDLHDKGDFYKGIFIEVQGDKAIVDSTDGKSRMLQENYGIPIFGLNRDSKEDFKPIAEDFLRQGIIKELNRK